MSLTPKGTFCVVAFPQWLLIYSLCSHFQPALWQTHRCFCSSLTDYRQCSTHSTVCWLESKNLAHVLAEGPGDVCTDLVWVLNTYLGLLCVKGRISLSNLCSFQTWCSSFWRGRHRNHVLSSLHEARGILLLQSPNSLNVGWPRPLAFQTSPQMYVFRDRSSYTRRSGYCQVLFMFGDGQYVIHKAQTEKMGHVCMALF